MKRDCKEQEEIRREIIGLPKSEKRQWGGNNLTETSIIVDLKSENAAPE